MTADNSIGQAAPDEGAASPRFSRAAVDLVVMVDSPDHVYYRKPGRIADIVDGWGDEPLVRSTTVIDRSSGLTSTWRAE